VTRIESSAAMRFLLDDVREFHQAMDIGCADQPVTDPDHALVRLRAKLIVEESIETVAGMLNVGDLDEVKKSIAEACADVDNGEVLFDIEQVADGLADLIYVCVGAALSFGIPLERVWAEVQRANCAKVGGPKRADGKQGKPEGWVGPRVHEAVFGEAGEAAE
jgi:predicted HAD superfamily Cof-like phosphohydrolase